MTEVSCPGLPAAWINGWLAALGATVLDGRVRLHWTTHGAPLAVLSADGVDPVTAVVESWPDGSLLADLPIAESWKDAGTIKRNVPTALFGRRARAARSHACCWTLSSTMTDLCVDKHGAVQPGPFNPPAPKGITLHQRVVKVHGHVEPAAEWIRNSLEGRAKWVEGNGLGFDHARLGSQADDAPKLVDPVVEALAFFGLAVLPVRGDGRDRQSDRLADVRERQRGWLKVSPKAAARSFHWPAWGQPLDRHGIDALLDVWNPEKRRTWARVGVHAGWRTVSFQNNNPLDPTRAYGAERL